MLPQIILRSVPFCPRLQRAMVALAARGAGWATEDGPDVWPMPEDLPQMVLRRPGQDDEVYRKSIPMLEAIETLFPDQPLYPADPAARIADLSLMKLGRGLQLRLSDVTHAQDSVAHDMAVFRLTSRLHLIEGVLGDEFPREELDNPGAVFAPTLWRILVLDRRIGTHLLAGQANLTRWAKRLSEHPAVVAALGPGAEDRYLARLRQRNTVLVAEADQSLWSRI